MTSDLSDKILERLFRIRKGEFEKTFLMFLYAFNFVAAIVVGRVMKDTLFLTKSDLSWLPYMYIFVAIFAGLISYFYSKQIIYFPLKKVITTTLTSIIILMGLFRYLLEFYHLSWVIPALYIFIEIMVVLLMVQFWTFANELFNSREAKRLFGVIGGGQVLANLYSFPMKALKDDIGIYNLIFVSMISIGFCLIIVNYLSKKHHISSLRGRIKSRSTQKGTSWLNGTAFMSLRWHIMALSTLAILTVTFVDYQFKVMASFVIPEEELADFFFSVFAYCGVLSCIVQFFFTSRILEKYGILFALLILPISLLAGSGTAVFFAGFIGVTMAKGGELVTRYTVYDTTSQILYQPLPSTIRQKTKAIADGMMRPGAQVVAGIIFIVLNALFSINNQENILYLNWIIMVFIVAWISVMVSAKRSYVEALLIASERRGYGEALDSEDDERQVAVSRMVIQRALATNDEVQITNAIDVIPLSRGSSYDEYILPLLDSPYPRVRNKAIEYIGNSGNRKYSRKIQKLFADTDDEVRSSAIKMYCQLEHARAVPRISKYLQTDNPLVKAASITGLIQFGGLEGIMSSTAELKKMLDNKDPEQRKSGAQVLGYIKIKSFYQPLFSLINDDNINVQKAAIEAAGLMKSRELIPNMIYKLAADETSTIAIRSLASFKKDIIPYLSEVLALNSVSPKIIYAIPSILSLIEAPQSYQLLESLLSTKDSRMRSSVTKAMQKLYGKIEDHITPDYKLIHSTLQAELESYFQILQNTITISDSFDKGQLLIHALKDRANEALSRAFYLLGIIYPREQIDIVAYNIRSDNPTMRANASEIIDNICEADIKRCLLPILDTISIREKVEAGKKLFQLQQRSFANLLLEFLHNEGDEWLIACAIHAISEAGLNKHANEIVRYADHDNPVIRESVLYSLWRLSDKASFSRLVNGYSREKDKTVLSYLNYLLEAV